MAHKRRFFYVVAQFERILIGLGFVNVSSCWRLVTTNAHLPGEIQESWLHLVPTPHPKREKRDLRFLVPFDLPVQILH